MRTGASEQHQLSPIDSVSEGTTEQPERDQWNRNNKPDRTDRKGGMGHRVDLHRHRDIGHLVADRRQRLPNPESSVLRRFTQRPDVSEQPLALAAQPTLMFLCAGRVIRVIRVVRVVSGQPNQPCRQSRAE